MVIPNSLAEINNNLGQHRIPRRVEKTFLYEQ